MFVFIVLSFVLVSLGVTVFHPLVAIFGVGTISFSGTLYLANYLSGSNDLDKGEIRKALATAITMVYFSLLSVSLFSNENVTLAEVVDKELLQTVIDKYTNLMLGVIGFYFGSRGATEFVKVLKSGDSEESKGTQTALSIEGPAEIIAGQEIELKITGGNANTTWSVDKEIISLNPTKGEKVIATANDQITAEDNVTITATHEKGKSATHSLKVSPGVG